VFGDEFSYLKKYSFDKSKMNVEESSLNMRFMIASAAIGALVAGLGFYFLKRYR
jgi:hypothetical protein